MGGSSPIRVVEFINIVKNLTDSKPQNPHKPALKGPEFPFIYIVKNVAKW